MVAASGSGSRTRLARSDATPPPRQPSALTRAAAQRLRAARGSRQFSVAERPRHRPVSRLPQSSRRTTSRCSPGTDCGGGAQCATAIAPLDWANPGEGDDVELALVRHPASNGPPSARSSSTRAGPGPRGLRETVGGGRGGDFVRDSVDLRGGGDLRAQFDVIGWDPRGVGALRARSPATPIPADQDAFIYGIPDSEPGTPEWEAEVIDASSTSSPRASRTQAAPGVRRHREHRAGSRPAARDQWVIRP